MEKLTLGGVKSSRRVL